MARKHGKDKGILEHPKGSDKWWVRIYVNGREKRYRADNKTQAKAIYGRLQADIREKRYFPEKYDKSKDITLRVWIKLCLEGSTNRGVRNEERYGRFWSLLLGKRILTEITTGECRRLQKKMEKRGNRKPATINRHFAYLRRVLMLAVEDGKINRNPVSGIKFFPEEMRTRFLSDDELNELQKIMEPEDWKLVAFAVETGLRREEQFKLRWDQISLETSTLVLPLPKGGKTRHVPLSECAKEILRSFVSFLSSPWVFPCATDPRKPQSAQSFINRIYTPALKRTGVTGACWHTLRHTAASRRVMAGVSIYTVKEILGHRDITTTMRYSHLTPEYLQDAVNRGSLAGTVTRTVTNEESKEKSPEEETSQAIDNKKESDWLGDEGSNLDRQIQNTIPQDPINMRAV